MGARNCARCGKIFNYLVGAPLCPLCKEEDEKDFKRVKEFLYKYPGSNMSEVSTALDISVAKIKRFLKEGRLEIKDFENLFLECERCGTAIKTGQFCDACTKEVAAEVRGVRKKDGYTRESKGSKAAKMRYLNKLNDE